MKKNLGTAKLHSILTSLHTEAFDSFEKLSWFSINSI